MKAWLAAPPGVTGVEVACAECVIADQGMTMVATSAPVSDVLTCELVVKMPGAERSTYWFVVEALAMAGSIPIVDLDSLPQRLPLAS